MASGNYISEHDRLISEKLGYVMCGGDLSARTDVSEQCLLDLERRAFLELCTKRKTLERMQSLIQRAKSSGTDGRIHHWWIPIRRRQSPTRWVPLFAGRRRGEQVIRRLMSDFPQLDKERIDDVIVGNATQKPSKDSTSDAWCRSWGSTRRRCPA